MLGIVIPDQIVAIVGPAHKEKYNGLVGPMGARLSFVRQRRAISACVP